MGAGTRGNSVLVISSTTICGTHSYERFTPLAGTNAHSGQVGSGHECVRLLMYIKWNPEFICTGI